MNVIYFFLAGVPPKISYLLCAIRAKEQPLVYNELIWFSWETDNESELLSERLGKKEKYIENKNLVGRVGRRV